MAHGEGMDLSSQIRERLEARMADGTIPGAIVQVSDTDSTLAVVAVGSDSADDQHPLAPDSLFAVASLSKVVTAAAACELVAQDRIDLDAPLSAYIPEFAQPAMVRVLKPGQSYPPLHLTPGDPPGGMPDFDLVPASRPITVRHILNFTSGLQTIGLPNPTLPETAPDDSIASYAAKLPAAALDFEPGSRWAYSNATGYEVLARVIECAADMPFDAWCRQLLFEPLGMNDTRFGLPDDLRARLADGQSLKAPRTYRTDYASGSAGLFTTVGDYTRFGQMLLGGGQFCGRAILSPKAVAMMHEGQLGDAVFTGPTPEGMWIGTTAPAPGLTYGFGVMIVTDPGAADLPVPRGSYGWDGIGSRRFWVMPGIGAVLTILLPGMGHHLSNVHREIERIVVADLQD